jgi:hypothetical protein
MSFRDLWNRRDWDAHWLWIGCLPSTLSVDAGNYGRYPDVCQRCHRYVGIHVGDRCLLSAGRFQSNES